MVSFGIIVTMSYVDPNVWETLRLETLSFLVFSSGLNSDWTWTRKLICLLTGIHTWGKIYWAHLIREDPLSQHDNTRLDTLRRQAQELGYEDSE